MSVAPVAKVDATDRIIIASHDIAWLSHLVRLAAMGADLADERFKPSMDTLAHSIQWAAIEIEKRCGIIDEAV